MLIFLLASNGFDQVGNQLFSLSFEHFVNVKVDMLQCTCHKQYD